MHGISFKYFLLDLWLLAVHLDEEQPEERPVPDHLAAYWDKNVLGGHLPSWRRVCTCQGLLLHLDEDEAREKSIKVFKDPVPQAVEGCCWTLLALIICFSLAAGWSQYLPLSGCRIFRALNSPCGAAWQSQSRVSASSCHQLHHLLRHRKITLSPTVASSEKCLWRWQ